MKQVLTNAIRRGTHGGGMFWEGEPRDSETVQTLQCLQALQAGTGVPYVKWLNYFFHGKI
jgi:hypothetical protein